MPGILIGKKVASCKKSVIFARVMAITRKRRKAQRSPISVAINAAGFSLEDVARLAGLSIGRVRNLVSRSLNSPVGRAKIMAATGLPLWTVTRTIQDQ